MVKLCKSGFSVNWRLIVSAGVFVLFVALIEYIVGWRTLLSPWAKLSLTALITAIGLLFVSYGLRAFRLYDYFVTDMSGRFVSAVRVMLQHNMLNNLLPMRTGEVSFPILMHREFNIEAMRSIPALLWFRLLDLHILLTLVLLAAGMYWISLWIAVVASLLFLSFPWWVYISQQRLTVMLNRKSEKSRRSEFLERALMSLPQTDREFWRSWFWTALNWVVKMAVLAWVLQAFYPMPIQAAWLGVIAGDFTSVLPIHGVAGAGTYEAGVLFGLMPFSLSVESSLAAAVNLHLFILGNALLGGLISLLVGRKVNRVPVAVEK